MSRSNSPVWRGAFISLVILLVTATGPAAGEAVATYSLVINNGRVIDPETGLDAVRHLGIRDGRIVVVSESSLVGEHAIDARGRVVAPGFIDIHSHSLTPLGQIRNVLDGVTTQLEMEAGALPAAAAGDSVREHPIINYGASVGHFAARIQVIEARELRYFFYRGEKGSMDSPAFTQPASTP